MLDSWRLTLVHLLLLSSKTIAQPTHDAIIATPSPDRSGEAKGTTASSTLSPSPQSFSIQGNATCPSRTANYITHTLPQQCLRTNRLSIANGTEVVAGPPLKVDFSVVASDTPEASSTTSSTLSSSNVEETPTPEFSGTPSQDSSPTTTIISKTVTESSLPTLEPAEAETDSPLDNANFLSFEEWKKQNLAKAGQSPENLAGRAQPHGERRRPGINNALDTLGEENEIELDFSGFGGGFDSAGKQQPSTGSERDAAVPSSPAQQAHRSKDAGKTCKERTNYASFDCAATMLKNNPECKSGSSVLVENKDSYLLNKCSADNKFIIVELCNDILIDTIVLANYEFFSSIFRHFRISVSDRYPVKMEKWKTLGTFEARNTREVQAFLIENPLIWARYLRIEFLTHYGNEYFCPVSLLRVHGTTMMDEFRHQEEVARGEPQDDDVVLEEEATAEATARQEPADATPVQKKQTVQAIPSTSEVPTPAAASSVPESSTTATSVSPTNATSSEALGTEPSAPVDDDFFANATCATVTSSPSTPPSSEGYNATSLAAHDLPTDHSVDSQSHTLNETVHPSQQSAANVTQGSASNQSSADHSTSTSTGSNEQAKPIVSITEVRTASTISTTATSSQSAAPASGRSQNDTASQPSSKVASSNTTSTRPASSIAPHPAQPSTQESFFKSVHKRLQQLESNSTLSLQYIEEQSRILRDAFNKVEKRQVATTANFLNHVNETIMAELQGFRQAYDQLWQSTVLELESQREQYQREMLALSTRLTLIADELLWQKRMGIVQSTLLLLCLGLVLFNRAGSSALDMPLVQQMMHKSQAAFRAGFESPPNSPSPDSRSPVSLFRRKLWRHSEPASGHVTDEVESRPPSQGGPSVNLEPPTPDALSEEEDESGDGEWKEVPEVQSGPTTPSGLRDENGPPIWPEDAATNEISAQLVP